MNRNRSKILPRKTDKAELFLLLVEEKSSHLIGGEVFPECR